MSYYLSEIFQNKLKNRYLQMEHGLVSDIWVNSDNLVFDSSRLSSDNVAELFSCIIVVPVDTYLCCMELYLHVT